MKMRKTLAVLATLVAVGCTGNAGQDPLPSWNETPIKKHIIDFVENKTSQIPVEDRIAVFDMDGTIACERPLWFEMAVSAHKMNDQLADNPELGKLTDYQYAKKLTINQEDTSVTNNWYVNGQNYIDSMLVKPFVGEEYEEYINYSRNYLTENRSEDYGMRYADMFYQPMLELINYLRSREYQVFIVSGSMQAIVWSIVPQATGLDRHHLIGTRQKLQVNFSGEGKPSYIIQKGVQEPKNNYYGKSINIFNQIGKLPVIAIGNTVGDFGMFHMATSNPLPHLALMLNHDDAEREYAYKPYYDEPAPAWEDSIRVNNWLRADMSKEFKTVWMEK